MKLRRILNELEISNQSPKFIFSHSFTNPSGKRVMQYKMSDGFGGYARVIEHNNGFEITNVIIDEELRNKGIGTQFYIEMNDESYAKTGKPLRSIKPDKNGNVELSVDGKRLWDSLVKKGLAKRVKSSEYRFK